MTQCTEAGLQKLSSTATASTGQRFCIVRPVSKRFAETATEWQQKDIQ